MVKAQKYMYVNSFVGEPKITDFQLVDEELPTLKDNEVLVKADYHSVDPYMRGFMAMFPPGVIMIGEQVATVLESKHPKYPVGSHVYASFGWRTHTVFNPDDGSHSPFPPLMRLPSFGKYNVSLALGVLGGPGLCAYFALIEMCKPKAGETVVVTGAAGAVGSIAGQIAKSLGCRVVGLAGTDAKLDWLRQLGFDEAINYKTADVPKALREAAPDGYDCYFDNVGGELSSQIIGQMRHGGRIVVCGSMSSYNAPADDLPRATILQQAFVLQSLEMRGFALRQFVNRWQEGYEALFKLLEAGHIQFQETVTVGFEKMPEAFIDMLRGGNTGKALVKTNV